MRTGVPRRALLCLSFLVPVVPFSLVLRTFPSEQMGLALFVMVPMYAASLYLDVAQTVKFGRVEAGAREIAMPFRPLTRRWGFGAAIAVQVPLEAVAAAAVIPLCLTLELGASVTTTVLLFLAMLHCYGWHANRQEAATRVPRSGENGR